MDATDVGTIVSTFIGDIGGVLTANLPVVLGVAAGLVGLGILLYYTRRLIGRK